MVSLFFKINFVNYAKLKINNQSKKVKKVVDKLKNK
jgi:hypothetical protein